jgi:hypothetical protein
MKKIFVCFCMFGLVYSCSKDELLPAGSPAGDNPLAVTFVGVSSREEWIDSPQASTRANDTSWAQDDMIGIYMLPSGNYDLSSSVWKNRKYEVTPSGTLSPNGSANTLYYPVNGDNVRFVAYYPYSSAATNTATLNKVSFDFADQSTQAKKEAVDFCFHRGETDYSQSSQTGLTLKFNHKFSKILMTVKSGSGGPSSVKNVVVTLGGMPKTATADLDNLARQQAGNIQVVNAGTNVSTIKAFTHSASTDAEATVEAIVAPHSGTGSFASRVFTFTIGSDVKTYKLPDNIEFESGKLYHFNFILKKGTTIADGMSNCYIVVPDGTLEFPVSRAYVYDPGSKDFTNTLHTGGEYTEEFDAAIVWDDNGVLKTGNDAPTVTGKGKTAKVTVKTKNKTGNAVVAIKKKTNSEIVWSYHIWVTKYDPDTDTYSNNNLVFMNRNLGATFAGFDNPDNPHFSNQNFGMGLFYQWGRKDPFPATKDPGLEFEQAGGGSFTVEETLDTNGTIPYTIRNPNVFLIVPNASNTVAGDWHHGSRNNTLWDDSGKKTIYDPCPYGWRVPKYSQKNDKGSPWRGFEKTASNWIRYKGYTWDSNAIYPYTDFRICTTGKCIKHPRLANGSYWSASPSAPSPVLTGDTALDLFLTEDVVNIADNAHRAHGFVVRCVREER